MSSTDVKSPPSSARKANGGNRDDDDNESNAEQMQVFVRNKSRLVYFGSAIVRDIFDAILLDYNNMSHLWTVVAILPQPKYDMLPDTKYEVPFELFSNKQKQKCLEFIRLAYALLQEIKKQDEPEITKAECALRDFCAMCTATEVEAHEPKTGQK